MKVWIKSIFSILLTISFGLAPVYGADSQRPPKWSYDPGPLNSEMGRELMKLTAEIPNMPAISDELMPKQKFRPAFGPIPWRMLMKPNSVKMLFIGQDGTHIAEAAARPATAGFGGRAQDLANYFGVDYSAAFINTYAFTIKGQYGAYQTPFLIKNEKTGEIKGKLGGYVDNDLWLMTHDRNSPVAQWRNKLIDWIIRNNKKSLRMIVLFGGAARDSIATYIESKNSDGEFDSPERPFKVGTRLRIKDIKSMQVPVFKEQYAGGNNVFPTPLGIDRDGRDRIKRRGKDLYPELVGKSLDYTKPADQKAATSAFLNKNKVQDFYKKKLVFIQGGSFKNGFIHPAQVGGFDLRKIKINGKETISLKGLPLNDGSKIPNHVLVAQLPHPSSLSRMSKPDAGKAVARAIKAFDKFKGKWSIAADGGQRNKYEAGEDYSYGRGRIGPEYYDFGTPASRMVPVSSAKRMRGKANVIILGTRDDGMFDTKVVDKMTRQKLHKSQKIDDRELFNARPRVEFLSSSFDFLDSDFNERNHFDPGPPTVTDRNDTDKKINYARIMKEGIDFDAVFTSNETGKVWQPRSKELTAAYNTSTHPNVADFGHYRGKFVDPKIVVLADPIGLDDIITARALTGTRGQYLQGLMNDVGIGDQYLMLKTVPFGMDNATQANWDAVLKATEEYRFKTLDAVFSQNDVSVLITDGEQAADQVKNGSLAELVKKYKLKVVNIKRGRSDKAGLSAAAKALSKLGFKGTSKGIMTNIPRTHLSFYARAWEGTTGDRVLAPKASSNPKYHGVAFAEVTPSWVTDQKAGVNEENIDAIEDIKIALEENGRGAKEAFNDMISRLGLKAGGRSADGSDLFNISVPTSLLPADLTEKRWEGLDDFYTALEQYNEADAMAKCAEDDSCYDDKDEK